jgi:transcriptional regulator GlxA family with amidase domain
MDRRRVGIVVFPEVEVLDFCGPFEVFSAARLDEAKRREGPSPFDVIVVAESREAVTATGGLRVLPDTDLRGCPLLDVLVVPGGWGTRKEVNNERLIGWLRRRAVEAELVASVCTGSFLLAQAGLLAGRRATTHWRSLDRLAETYPDVTVVRDEHVVEDDTLITSAGISAGIDMALRVVARLHGEAVARATARHMEYPYPADNRRRV